LNLRRILNLAAALAAVFAAAAVCVVAAAFSLYAVTRAYIGPAGGAAAVAVAFAIVALIVAWLATRKVTPRTHRGARADDASLIDRLIVMAKERPLVALGAAAAAAFVLLRNPTVVTAIVSAVVAGKAAKPDK
jgi:uncharacterized membrane protein